MTWLTNWLAARLSPAERDAVLGDALERDTSALRDLVSVLVWREARAWSTMPPWIALFVLVVPLGFVLTVIARSWSTGFAVMLWIYVNNWTSEYLTNPGARHDVLVDFVGTTTLQVLCLMLWSWTVGRALRTLAGGAIVSSAVVLTAVVLAASVGTTTVGVLNPANAIVFSSPFYRVTVPLIARVMIVLVPFWWAVLSGDNARRWWTLARAVATTIFIGVTFKSISEAVVFGWVPMSMTHARFGTALFSWMSQLGQWSLVLRLLAPLALAWPAAYLLIHDRWRLVA
jgi:hypothetical protein